MLGRVALRLFDNRASGASPILRRRVARQPRTARTRAADLPAARLEDRMGQQPFLPRADRSTGERRTYNGNADSAGNHTRQSPNASRTAGKGHNRLRDRHAPAVAGRMPERHRNPLSAQVRRSACFAGHHHSGRAVFTGAAARLLAVRQVCPGFRTRQQRRSPRFRPLREISLSGGRAARQRGGPSRPYLVLLFAGGPDRRNVENDACNLTGPCRGPRRQQLHAAPRPIR